MFYVCGRPILPSLPTFHPPPFLYIYVPNPDLTPPSDPKTHKSVGRVQESFLAEQLMNVLGVSRILDESGGKEWGGVSGIEPFVPKGHVRHYEGELQRKFKVSPTKYTCLIDARIVR